MTKHSTSFTFVMPCYNGEKYIKQGIESILSVNYPKNKFSLIVVDDGSTDQTVAVIKKCRFKRVKLIQLEKNRGPANARNIGKNMTATDYVVFIDTETIVDKNILLQYETGIKKFPLAVFCGEVKFFGRKNLNTKIIEKGKVFSMREGPDANLLWAATNNLCVPKKVYQKYSFNPKFSAAEGEDIDFCFTIKKAGYKIVFNPKAIASHKSFATFNEAVSRTFRYGKATSMIVKTNPGKSLLSWELTGRIILLISFIFTFFLAYQLKSPAYLFWPLFHFSASAYYLFSECYTNPKIYKEGLWFTILTSIYKAFMMWIYQLGIITGNIKNRNRLVANLDYQYMLENGNSRLPFIWFLDDIIVAIFFLLLIK